MSREPSAVQALTQSKHTPGPWIAKPESSYLPAQVWTEDGRQLAEVYGEDRETRANNARLIAAAPDLLEALRIALPLLQDEGADGYAAIEVEKTRKHVYTRAAMVVQAAIAKATGAEPQRQPGTKHWCKAGSHAYQCHKKTCIQPYEVASCPEHRIPSEALPQSLQKGS